MIVFLISDIYLGMKFAGYPSVQERLVEARFDTLKRSADIANEEACDLFVVGGDIFLYPFHVKGLLKNRKPGTAKNVLELLRRIVNFGVEKQLCKGPSVRIKVPSVHNKKTEDLTPKQLQRLLEAIKEDPHDQAGKIMLMALYTGMRRGELFRLKWEDIDFDRGFIHIRNPKGGIDQSIPLNDAAREVLEFIIRTDDSPYVFPGRNGGQRTDIHHQVNRIKQRAGLPKDFRALHGLRHVYASMLASSGKVDMYTLQKLLTHKSPKMAQRYAHLSDEALKNASNVAAEIINGMIKHKPEKVISITDSN